MKRAISFLGALAAFAVACGGGSGSQFGGDNNGGNGGGSSGDLPGFNNDPVGTNAACVTSTANAALSPVNLVFMYDKSGSMGDPAEGFDPNTKWIPVGTGMKAFFDDPASKGINSSLQFFPEGTDVTTACTYNYGTPKIALTALTDPAPLTSAIDATQPSGGTPTLPALEGAISYAKQVSAQHAGENTAVVLVTDGLPGYRINGQNVTGCPENDISHVADTAAAAYKASPSIPTYVIGVGSSLDNLNQIAASGGTKSAFMVSVVDPTATKTVFQNALNAIRSAAVTCDFAMPPPPAGQDLDTQRVNVAYETSGHETVLTYSADCSNGQGWHYDDPSKPTKILLCPSSCGTIQADRTGKITIAFGCQTKQATR